MSTLRRAALLRQRADLLEKQARIDRDLAELETLSAPAAELYTSVEVPRELRHLTDPKRAFASACRRLRARGVVGPEIVGAGRSRVWTCPAPVWRDAQRAAPVLRIVEPSVDDAAAQVIEAAAFRATRRTA